MKEYVNKIKTYTTAFIYAICFCTSVVYAGGNPAIKVDGYNEIVVVQHESDERTGFLKILGTYGTVSPTTVELTDPGIFHAFSPLLATSRSKSSCTAVAIWRALDLKQNAQVLQAAVASNKGWTKHSGFTISNPINEIPQSEVQVDISDDGLVIGVCWTTYIISTGDVAVRKNYSIDGGETWSDPVTL